MEGRIKCGRKRFGEIFEEKRLKKFEASEKIKLEDWATESDREHDKDNWEPLDDKFSDSKLFLDNGDDLDDDQASIMNEDLTKIEKESLKDEEVVSPQKVPKNEGHSFNSSGPVFIHPEISETLKLWTRGGISSTDIPELFSKYSPPEAFRTPVLNEEIAMTLHKRPIDNDQHLRNSQDFLASALTALGLTLSRVFAGKNGLDREKVMNGMNDTAKILSGLYYFNTNKRRSQIISLMPNQHQRSLLDDTKPDEFLFGVDLKSKIEEVQRLEKIVSLKQSVNQKGNDQSRRSVQSPYQQFDKDEDEEVERLMLNPMNRRAKFFCKEEEEFEVITLE